jgi:NADH:ubiquinone oxidoreductase subunit
MFCTASLPRKWSMRKIDSSGKTRRIVSLRARAEARSRPNGFSTMIRAPSVQRAAVRLSTTAGNMLGGMAR